MGRGTAERNWDNQREKNYSEIVGCRLWPTGENVWGWLGSSLGMRVEINIDVLNIMLYTLNVKLDKNQYDIR